MKNIKQKDDQVIITVENVSENLQNLLKVAGKIESVEVRNTTLNDVFLHFTGRRIHQEGGNTWFDKIVQESVSKQ